MNFQTILEELDRLYEEDNAKAVEEVEETAEEAVEEEAVKEELKEEVMTEAAEDDEEIEIVDDEEVEEATEEVSEEEPRLVLECSSCGAIYIKAEGEVELDEETAMANLNDVCQYCEASEGYKILGIVSPYGETETEAEEPVKDAEEIDVTEDEVAE
jgi:hypothetical protein